MAGLTSTGTTPCGNDRTLVASPHDPLFALARAILFELDPEHAHDLALRALALNPLHNRGACAPLTGGNGVFCLGRQFANRVGLAAGLDKNGDYIDALGAFGFGAVEIGTVTPHAQPGNPKPRLFRLPLHGSLINRFGFNNKGVDHLAARAAQRRYTGRLGINIGKNAHTPLDRAVDDYLYCLERVYPYADYVTINVSSPNTAGLRDLQRADQLERLLETLKNAQSNLASRHDQHIPLVLKLSPDLDDAALDEVCRAVRATAIEGIIATNTTNRRSGVAQHVYAAEAGGLSGRALRALADDRLGAIAARLDDSTTLIGVGGIETAAHALDKRRLGAELVQLYTGFIFHGPALVRDCIRSTA